MSNTYDLAKYEKQGKPIRRFKNVLPAKLHRTSRLSGAISDTVKSFYRRNTQKVTKKYINDIHMLAVLYAFFSLVSEQYAMNWVYLCVLQHNIHGAQKSLAQVLKHNRFPYIFGYFKVTQNSKGWSKN